MSERNWKETILLPQTDFPMRANLANREPEAVASWKDAGLYKAIRKAREGRPAFVLHDGPPYANGDIHHGHALNKVLKDFVVKYRWVAGYDAMNRPGWDCHGLPIEQKVDEELGGKKRELDVIAFRKACRDYADKWVNAQKEQFERLMVLAEWDRPYRTMDYAYEATIVRELGRVIEGGYVYKGLKPVHWSWAARTALADAEVEYDVYDAPSVYVRFDFYEAPEWLREKAGGRAIDVVIWTTTPWTIPSNLAIALNPELEYELLALDEGASIIVAAGLKEEVLKQCGLQEPAVLASFKGAELVGHSVDDCPRLNARHPFIDRDSVLLPADYVTLDQGTGCVHTAPGHGVDDYQTGRKFGLDVLAPVDAGGQYTAEVPDYEGMHVFKANPLIAQRLHESGRLLNRPDQKYRVERYPHCWRTKKPLIFRATPQWFIDVEHEELRQRSLSAIGSTKWVPHWGENRIRGMMETRPDWCISRQRAWGVPITVFTCTSCNEEVVDHRVAYHVAELVESEGADAWFAHPAEELVPAGFRCPHCDAEPGAFEKAQDILDVWFDSGVSWAAVLRDQEGLEGVADLYLEGSDQHRGWFHTSLLTSVAITGHAPYKTVLTHGFLVDDKGRKFSKSNPNFKPLSKAVNQYGAEILRMWVAAVDYRQDIVFSDGVLKQVSDSYRKVRNTIRFLLGNLSDFDPDRFALDPTAMSGVDRWALRELNRFITEAKRAYENYEFHTFYHALNEFCNLRMSAVYLDTLKDRMYCDGQDDPARRASQAVMYEVLRALVTLCWPVLTFTAEEAWSMMPHREGDDDFAALTLWPEAHEVDASDSERFERWLELRQRVQALIEERRPRKKGEREPGQIGSSQEALVTIYAKSDEAAELREHAAELAELFIVSEVRVEDGAALEIQVEPSSHERCQRCWNYRPDVGDNPDYSDLCGRCGDVVAKL